MNLPPGSSISALVLVLATSATTSPAGAMTAASKPRPYPLYRLTGSDPSSPYSRQPAATSTSPPSCQTRDCAPGAASSKREISRTPRSLPQPRTPAGPPSQPGAYRPSTRDGLADRIQARPGQG